MPPSKSKKFYWEEFQEWLKEGLLAASIVNKLMLATWPAEKRNGLSIEALPNELLLLRAMRNRMPRKQKTLIKRVLANIESDFAYPLLEEEDIMGVWKTLMAYRTKSDYYRKSRQSMETLLQSDAGSQQIADDITQHIWHSLAPALVPDPRMVKGTFENTGFTVGS